MDEKRLMAKARLLRRKTIHALFTAQSGHPGPALSIADLVAALYFHEMKLEGEDRDRFVLSKGHAVTAVYAAFTVLGWIEDKELETLRKFNTRLQGHPDATRLPFLDAGTGALGQGASIAIGYALAAKLKKSPARAYCIIGDGECQEGQIWEAAMYAAARKMDNLVFILDDNKFQNEDYVAATLPMGSLADKWRSFDWHVLSIDGHDLKEIARAFTEARQTKNKPTIIIADTVKGKGVDFMESNMVWHSRAMNEQEYKRAMDLLEENRP